MNYLHIACNNKQAQFSSDKTSGEFGVERVRLQGVWGEQKSLPKSE